MSMIEQSFAAQGEAFLRRRDATGRVIALCISSGGIPKRPLPEVQVVMTGFLRDGHAHEKHNRPDRALSLLDVEILDQLRDEGFDLQPGMLGENLTAVGLLVQDLPSRTLLMIGEVVLRLEQPRQPCYVLDAIDVRLKDILVGRCGYMASVVRCGKLKPGMEIVTLPTGRVNAFDRP